MAEVEEDGLKVLTCVNPSQSSQSTSHFLQ